MRGHSDWIAKMDTVRAAQEDFPVATHDELANYMEEWDGLLAAADAYERNDRAFFDACTLWFCGSSRMRDFRMSGKGKHSHFHKSGMRLCSFSRF